MGILFFLIFVAVWYLPMLIRHRKTVKESWKYYIAAFFMGVLAAALSAVIQLGGAFIIYKAGVNLSADAGVANLLWGALKTLVFTGVCEEMIKYGLGSQVVKRVPDLTEAGCMIIMGMTGLGFEMMESMGSADLISGILRGVTELHLFFQLWMGKYSWRAQSRKAAGDPAGYKKNMRIAILVPIVFHFLYDFFLFKGTSLMGVEDSDSLQTLGILLLLLALVTAILFIVMGLISVNKTLKAEKQEVA